MWANRLTHNQPSSPSQNSFAIGTSAALSLTLLWSFWLVVSRAGALSSITPYDLAAMRYGISAIFALPFVLYFKPWRTMTLSRILVVSFLLGPVYVLILFGAFELAPASHGGVFMNGTLPIITLLIGWLWLKQSPGAFQLGASSIVLIGVLLIVGGNINVFVESWLGDLMFIGAAVFFCFYVAVSRQWNVTGTQVLLCGSVLNAALFVPVWYFFLPSGLSDAPTSQLWLQGSFQGLVPNLFGLLMIAIAARHIGPAATTAIMASVPGLSGLLSYFFLGEVVGTTGWVGIFLLTVGILMMTPINWRNTLR